MISSVLYVMSHATPLLFLVGGVSVRLGWDLAGYVTEKVSVFVRGKLTQPHCSHCCERAEHGR